MRTILLAAVALTALSGAAHAQRFSNLTGERLANLCISKDPRAVEGCTAYIDGIADAAGYYQRLRPSDGSKGSALPGYICIPGPVTGVQLRRSVVDWFGKHRDQANRQASGMVLRALDETFLCPGEGSKMQPE